MMRRTESLALTLLLAAPLAAQATEASSSSPPALPVLAEPFVVEADGAPIACKTGHAAPDVADFDGDGVWDLAVGEFGGGTCRLYKNVGSNTEPKFGAFTLLQSDGKPAAMESS